MKACCARNNRRKMNETDRKKEIFRKVADFYRFKHAGKAFVPGKTRIQFGGRVFDEREMIAMTDAVLDFWLTLGKYAREFESDFARHLSVKHAIVTNSGSSANLLAVSVLMSRQLKDRIKPGSEAITPASTFPTTINPLIQNNLVPVLLDVELGTYNINAKALENAITKKTRLVMLPHTLGNPNDMKTVMDVAEDHHLRVVEDACDALDSSFGGRLVGTFGDIGTFSFYPAHHISMGEGGALATNDSGLDREIRSLRDWGRACYCPQGAAPPNGACGNRLNFKINGMTYDHRYVYSNIGYNLKPTDIQCAMGVEQLKKLPAFTRKRRENFRKLYAVFRRFREYFILPASLPKAKPSWFAFPLTLRETCDFTREDFTSWLELNNIETRLLFAGNIVSQPAYEGVSYRISGSLKNSNAIMKNTFFIGLYPGIDERMIRYVKEKTGEFMECHTPGKR
jgi:CDP-6-deoxy-D-xylo-4-hexulose-3-dehydrase